MCTINKSSHKPQLTFHVNKFLKKFTLSSKTICDYLLNWKISTLKDTLCNIYTELVTLNINIRPYLEINAVESVYVEFKICWI